VMPVEKDIQKILLFVGQKVYCLEWLTGYDF